MKDMKLIYFHFLFCTSLKRYWKFEKTSSMTFRFQDMEP